MFRLKAQNETVSVEEVNGAVSMYSNNCPVVQYRQFNLCILWRRLSASKNFSIFKKASRILSRHATRHATLYFFLILATKVFRTFFFSAISCSDSLLSRAERCTMSDSIRRIACCNLKMQYSELRHDCASLTT